MEKIIKNIDIGRDVNKVYLIKKVIIFVIESFLRFAESLDMIGNMDCSKILGDKNIGVVRVMAKLKIPVTAGLCKTFKMIYLPEENTYDMSMLIKAGNE